MGTVYSNSRRQKARRATTLCFWSLTRPFSVDTFFCLGPQNVPNKTYHLDNQTLTVFFYYTHPTQPQERRGGPLFVESLREPNEEGQNCSQREEQNKRHQKPLLFAALEIPFSLPASPLFVSTNPPVYLLREESGTPSCVCACLGFVRVCSVF